GDQLEFVALAQRQVPGNGDPEPLIHHRRVAGMPGEKNLGGDIVALPQALVERSKILDWVGYDKRQARDAARHAATAASKTAHCCRVNSRADHGATRPSIAAASNDGARSHSIPRATCAANSGSS